MITITEQTLSPLSTPKPCGVASATEDAFVFCGKPATWAIDDIPVCDHDIAIVAGMNSDNEAFLLPALRGMAA